MNPIPTTPAALWSVCCRPAGRAAVENAAPGHVEDVRRNFIDLMTPAQLDMLAALNERILHHLASVDDSSAGLKAHSQPLQRWHSII